jgi:NAD(P)-dependent dehydrogenase (short-subunit alcohol dehydrogenase family)
MTHLAIVTGGMRGLGAAILFALPTGEYRVATAYGRNDAVADKFYRNTRLP